MQDEELRPMPTPAQVCQHFDQQLAEKKMDLIFAACGDLAVHEAMTGLLESAIMQNNPPRCGKKRRAALELMAGPGMNHKKLAEYY